MCKSDMYSLCELKIAKFLKWGELSSILDEHIASRGGEEKESVFRLKDRVIWNRELLANVFIDLEY